MHETTPGKRGRGKGAIAQWWTGLREARVGLPGGKWKSFDGQGRTAVRRTLTAALRGVPQGVPVLTGHQTFGQFLDHWLADVAKPSTRPRIDQRYADVVRLRLAPVLSRTATDRLTPQRIQTALGALATTGLSPHRGGSVRSALRTALNRSRHYVHAAGRLHVRASSASGKRSPLRFFLLLYALSLPFWLIGAIAERGLPLPMTLPVSALAFVCPLMAALILVYREDQRAGVRRLLQRVFDYTSITRKIWYVPILLLVPAIYGLSYVVMHVMGLPLPEPHVPILTIPILLIVFLVGAVGEEAGYMGYAVDPLQERWSALTTGIVLGLGWGAAHVVPDLQNHHGLAWIAWQRGVYDVALRVLIVWLYNNTGQSVLAAILFHDTDNVSVSFFQHDGSHYDPAVTGAITAITAAIIVFLGESKTLEPDQKGAGGCKRRIMRWIIAT